MNFIIVKNIQDKKPVKDLPEEFLNYPYKFEVKLLEYSLYIDVPNAPEKIFYCLCQSVQKLQFSESEWKGSLGVILPQRKGRNLDKSSFPYISLDVKELSAGINFQISPSEGISKGYLVFHIREK